MSELCPKILGEWHYTQKRKLEKEDNPIKLVLKHAQGHIHEIGVLILQGWLK